MQLVWTICTAFLFPELYLFMKQVYYINGTVTRTQSLHNVWHRTHLSVWMTCVGSSTLRWDYWLWQLQCSVLKWLFMQLATDPAANLSDHLVALNYTRMNHHLYECAYLVGLPNLVTQLYAYMHLNLYLCNANLLLQTLLRPGQHFTLCGLGLLFSFAGTLCYALREYAIYTMI